MGVHQMTTRMGAGQRSRLVTKNVMDIKSGVRTLHGTVESMSIQRMTPRPHSGALSVLESLSPEMARDLGQAFSLAQIGSSSRKPAPAEETGAARGALRMVGRLAAFMLVAIVAVSLAATALYLLPLP